MLKSLLRQATGLRGAAETFGTASALFHRVRVNVAGAHCPNPSSRARLFSLRSYACLGANFPREVFGDSCLFISLHSVKARRKNDAVLPAAGAGSPSGTRTTEAEP